MQEILVTHALTDADFLKENGHNYFIHILCLTGNAILRIDETEYFLSSNALAIVLPHLKVEILNASPTFEVKILYISFELMSLNNPDISWGIKAYLYSKENPVIQLEEHQVQVCLSFLFDLHERSQNHIHTFRKQVLNLHIQLFIYEMWHIFSTVIQQQTAQTDKRSLFQRFLQLVEYHCMEQREVRFYANLLFITPKYLSELCKKHSGKSASEWIKNYTRTRLIMLLRNEQLSFIQIADTMHFSSQSFFSRYVKDVLGLTPSAYRARLANT
ncbi:AraC family transcriptional regulator [Leeuwenhoekiella palythoae]|uniref:AraC family transcriptional regulator n=1 Tax=Leeuwenhoekiella palythoae TaxID=573501 RepID=UPI0035122239